MNSYWITIKVTVREKARRSRAWWRLTARVETILENNYSNVTESRCLIFAKEFHKLYQKDALTEASKLALELECELLKVPYKQRRLSG